MSYLFTSNSTRIYSEELNTEALQDESGVELNGMIINNVRFPYDIVLLASTEEDLKRLIDKINESCKAYGTVVECEQDQGYCHGKIAKDENRYEIRWGDIRASKAI